MTKDASVPASVVDYIEGNLSGSLSLDGIAAATNYSKYHLYRCFTQEATMTVGDYISRRRLTEAARMLVFTDWSILDVATSVGFGSQQAFSAAFKRMFKKTPCQYRADEEFWPLQFELVLDDVASSGRDFDIRFAMPADEEAWMDLLEQVVDGYPHLNEGDYIAHLREAIARHEALVSMLAFALAHPLASLFAGTASLVFGMASEGLALFSLAYLFAGTNIFASSFFTALGNGALSAIVSFLRTFGLVPLCLVLLSRLFGVQGVWVVVPLAECITFVVAVALLAAFRRRYGY